MTAVRAVLTTFSDPYNAMDSRVYPDTTLMGAASIWPLAMVNSVHLYHMLGGFVLSSADYFHHLLFVPLLGFPGHISPMSPPYLPHISLYLPYIFPPIRAPTRLPGSTPAVA